VAIFVCFSQQFRASPQSSHHVLFCPIYPFSLSSRAVNCLFIIQGHSRTLCCSF
jgi:hypothetical protein